MFKLLEILYINGAIVMLKGFTNVFSLFNFITGWISTNDKLKGDYAFFLVAS